MGKHTRRASGCIRDLSSPPSHLDSPRPVCLLLSQDAAAPIAAIREVLVASNYKGQICVIVRKSAVKKESSELKTYVCA
jgi:hypothetical protein